MTAGDLLCPPAIAGDESGEHTGGGRDPLEILHLKPGGRRPKLLLITREVLQKRRKQPVLRIFVRLQPATILLAYGSWTGFLRWGSAHRPGYGCRRVRLHLARCN